MKNYWKDFIPQIFFSLKNYSKENFVNDLFSGVSVGIIAIPLALAFAIAAGLPPEKGLLTSIVAGFFISLLGGSKYQISGPTGAYVVILYDIVQRNGYEGLAAATLLASIIIILMGYAKIGSFLKFVPYPVIVGFTAGISLYIFSTQVKDFLGLEMSSIPSHFIHKIMAYYHHLHTINFEAFFTSVSTILILLFIRKIFPKAPSAILALFFATTLVYLLGFQVETIESRFGSMSQPLSPPSFSFLSLDHIHWLLPDALAIAFLGIIESLLCASIADGLSGEKHNPNSEIVAQGIGNLISVCCGGIPACGAIIRTSTNVKMGAKSPISAMIHSMSLLLFLLVLSPFAAKIPLAALSGIIVFIVCNIGELHVFKKIIKGQKGDALVLISTFLLTLLVDLTIAIPSGILLGAIIFINRMSKKANVYISYLKNYEIAIFEINGPFFYGITDILEENFNRLEQKPQSLILRLNQTSFIDESGKNALKKFEVKCRENNIQFLIADVCSIKKEWFKQEAEKKHLFKDFDSAVNHLLSL